MSTNRPVDPRSQVSERYRAGSDDAPPPGRRIQLTPTRVLLTVALVGSTAFLAYAFTIRDATQIPLLSASAIVEGLVLTAFAIAGTVEVVRAGREARAGRATLAAIFAGIAAIGALGCFAVAMVLAVLSPGA